MSHKIMGPCFSGRGFLREFKVSDIAGQLLTTWPGKRQIWVRDADLSCESLSGEEHSCSNAGNEGEEDPGNDGDRFLEVDE